jgi:hypothetical protein
MLVSDRMQARGGSAIVLAILLLVLLNAIGMYAVSLTGSVAEGQRHYQAAVAKNMARAGAHAAIARLPGLFPQETPYLRRMAVGPDLTGKYSVTSRRAGETLAGQGKERGIVFEDYAILSEGSASGSYGGTSRVHAEVRIGRVSSGKIDAQAPGVRARILKWEESGR